MNARTDFPVHPLNAQRPEYPMQSALPVHDARQLTSPGGQAQIVLDGQVYALRITRAGKLILTK